VNPKPPMRKAERAIPEDETRKLLEGCEYGTLSMTAPDGSPHAVPMSFVCLDNTIYFHCAMEGYKISCLNANPEVCFSAVGKTETLPAKFSTRFESVIVYGTARECAGDEKQKALEALIRKYSFGFLAGGLAYIARAAGKTRVYGIAIETITGKARRT